MKNEDIDASRRKGRFIGGAVFIIVGACLLLQRLDLNLPHWLFSWQMILIAVGIVVGAKHNFRFGGWIVMVLVGGIFLANEILNLPYDTARFIWPVALILVGIMLIFKRNYHVTEWPSKKHSFGSSEEFATGEDMLSANAIFGSVNKVVMSKNFKGGDVSAIFGGAVINFMNADINGTATLDVSAVFGGCEIIVPANWKVQVDIDAILGGVEDKRNTNVISAGPIEKLLILKGSCVFGGVEIKSY
jgi:predicted membrane protein